MRIGHKICIFMVALLAVSTTLPLFSMADNARFVFAPGTADSSFSRTIASSAADSPVAPAESTPAGSESASRSDWNDTITSSAPSATDSSAAVSEASSSSSNTSSENASSTSSNTSAPSSSSAPAASTASSSGQALAPSSSQSSSSSIAPASSTGKFSASQQGAVPIDENEEAPVFTATIVTDGPAPGIYGTLSHIPGAVTNISVLYSFLNPNEDASAAHYARWDMTPLSDGSVALTQLLVPADSPTFQAYVAERANNLYLQLYISRYNLSDIEMPLLRFTHNNVYEIPSTPPPFTVTPIVSSLGFYYLKGHFEAIPPNATSVYTEYSWDGITYQDIGDPEFRNTWNLTYLGATTPNELEQLQNQVCIYADQDPFYNYVHRNRDSFYLRMVVVTDTDEVFYSAPFLYERGEPKPAPANVVFSASPAFTMTVQTRTETDVKTHTAYRMTVRQNATPEIVESLLPSSIPVEISLNDSVTGEFITSGIAQCPVTWKPLAPLILEQQTLYLEDAALPLVVPKESHVVTPVGIFILPEDVRFTNPEAPDTITLELTPLTADAPPRAVLDESSLWNVMTPAECDYLRLAFWQKPTGATSLMAYSVVDGIRTEIGDLLTRRDVNHNQAYSLYGYVKLLHKTQSPYKEYLAGEIDSFSIEVEIEGGIFDGEFVTLPWPGPYYSLPIEIFEPDHAEGNENNAGSGDENDGSGGGNNGNGGANSGGNNGGQRPWLPPSENGAPPAQTGTPSVPAVATPQTGANSKKPVSSSPASSSGKPASGSDTFSVNSKSEPIQGTHDTTGNVPAGDGQQTAVPAPDARIDNTSTPISAYVSLALTVGALAGGIGTAVFFHLKQSRARKRR